MSEAAPHDDDDGWFDPALYLVQDTPSNLKTAQRLAEHGIAVFPCGSDKRPIGGLLWRSASTCDESRIARWWNRWPAALPAIDLAKCGLIVIDCDRKPGAADGVAAFDAMSDERGGIPSGVPAVRTPTGNGLHFYFRQPEGEPLGNRTGTLPAGVDVRGSGGYTVAPGAILPDGREWKSADGTPDLCEAFAEDSVPTIPAWLVDLIRAPKQHEESEAETRQEAPRASSGAAGERERAWAAKALEGVAADLAGVVEGGRNSALNASAYRLGRLVARGWLDQSSVVAALTGACRVNGLWKSDGPAGVRASLMSGLKGGLAKPHEDLPERDDGGPDFAALGEEIAARLLGEDDVMFDPETGEIINVASRANEEGGEQGAGGAAQGEQRDPAGQSANRDNLLVDAWLRLKLPPRDYLLGELLCTTSRWLLVGETGVGKTLFCLDMGGAIAAGAYFLDWKGKRRSRVMYLDGELPAETFKERIELIAKRYGDDIELFGYSRDVLGPNDMPPLNTPAGQVWLWREINIVKPDIIFFDSIMCLMSGDMKDDMSWEPVKRLIRKISSRRIAQIWMHHTGHDNSKGFGTKTREWEMDTVAMLTRATDDPDNNSIRLEFKKARLRTPKTFNQFAAKILHCDDDGWTAEDTDATVRVSKDTNDSLTLKSEIVKSYERLSLDVEASRGFTNTPVRKVSVDAIRDDLTRRGFLERSASGGIHATHRTRFHRAKISLIRSQIFVEDDGLMWQIKTNA